MNSETPVNVPVVFEKPVNEKFDKKKILVTGAEGFIASKVVQRLREIGHDVIGFDIVNGDDILKLTELEKKVKAVDIVYHIAAQADLTEMSGSVQKGRHGARINVEGTHNVAYLCAKHKKWLIYASTVCVYGNSATHPEKEDETIPNPSELYSCTKLAGELLVKGYGLNFGMPWTILRFATIYGEGMRKALGLHVFFRQAIQNQPITVHGDGEQIRTLTYINDLVEGIIAPLTHEKSKGQIINLTSIAGISANEMAKSVKIITGSSSEIVHIDQRPNQTLKEDFDVSKAKDLLEWEAKTPWDVGLRNTYEWMKSQTC